jgi:hypothetical protein
MTGGRRSRRAADRQGVDQRSHRDSHNYPAYKSAASMNRRSAVEILLRSMLAMLCAFCRAHREEGCLTSSGVNRVV